MMNEKHADNLKQSWQRSLLKQMLRVVAFFTILGLTLRLTIRDSLIGFSTLYYMTPLALIVVGAGMCLLSSYWNRKRFSSFFWLIVFSATLVWWIQTDWRFQTRVEVNEQEMTILFANIARTKDPESIAAKIREINPDIVALVEAMVVTNADRDSWKKTFPEYNYSMINGGTQLLAKGKIGPPWVKALKDGSKLSRSIVTIDGVDLHCYVVDIKSTITASREHALDELAKFTLKSTEKPVLIMGDFNTPPESVHFNALRENYVNLFESAGSGYAATWPFPLPVLALDQIWINHRVTPIECGHQINSRSDHRIIVGRIQVNRKASVARED